MMMIILLEGLPRARHYSKHFEHINIIEQYFTLICEWGTISIPILDTRKRYIINDLVLTAIKQFDY